MIVLQLVRLHRVYLSRKGVFPESLNGVYERTTFGFSYSIAAVHFDNTVYFGLRQRLRVNFFCHSYMSPDDYGFVDRSSAIQQRLWLCRKETHVHGARSSCMTWIAL